MDMLVGMFIILLERIVKARLYFESLQHCESYNFKHMYLRFAHNQFGSWKFYQ